MPLHAFQRTIVDSAGNVLPSANIEVKVQASGAFASIYSDVDGTTPLSNPTAADSSGFIRFYASPGQYRIRAYTSSSERIWEHEDVGALLGDVRDFGAVGDGVEDDTDAVQAWLNAGGELFGVPLTFRVTSQVTPVSGTKLDARGMKIIHDSSTIESVVYGDELTDVEIVGLEVDGKKTSKSGAGVQRAYGIDINGSGRLRVSNCYVHDTFEHGIRVGTVDNDDTSETTDVIITNNFVKDCGNSGNSRGYGVWTFGLCRRLVISNNIVIDCIAGGISTDETSSGGVADRTNFDVLIADNFVRVDDSITDSVGIRFEGSSRGTITGNEVHEAYHGLIVQEGQALDGLTSHLVVTGNLFRGIENGARIINVRDVVIDGNIFDMYGTSGTAGIDMFNVTGGSASERVRISNNVIRTERGGIFHGTNASHSGDSDAISISGNHVHWIGSTTPTGGTDDGIEVDNTTNSVVSDNVVHGFDVGLESKDGASWLNNKASDCATYGMRLSNSDSRVIQGNVMDGCSMNIASAANVYGVKCLENFSPSGVSGTFNTMYKRGNIGGSGFADMQASATTIADAASTLNTVAKHVGMLVYDETNNRLMRAIGGSATSAWYVIDGSASVTPA